MSENSEEEENGKWICTMYKKEKLSTDKNHFPP